MKRGRFFVYKYLFLLKTQIAIKQNPLRIIYTLFLLIRIYLSHTQPAIDSRFANTVSYLQNEKQFQKFVNAGFDKSSLVVTGSPLYDVAMKKLKNLKHPIFIDGKKRVLLATSPLYEHGLWTKEQRDIAVKGIISALASHKDVISLTIKIHPSTESLSYYQNIVNQIDPAISIYQEGDIMDYLEQSDIVISFPVSSTVLPFTIISRRPLVLCNFFGDETSEYVKRGIALELKSPNDVYTIIEQIQKTWNVSESKIQEFVRDVLYSDDGLASERVSDIILELTKKNKKKTS